jgi:drug/metabolite transporter (DMT)-like permease
MQVEPKIDFATISFQRGIITVILCAVVASAKGENLNIIYPDQFKLLIIRIVLVGFICLDEFFFGKYVPISLVTIIENITPIFLFMYEIFVLGKKFSYKEILALILAFLGIVLIVNPDIF